uniref:Coiled-coil-helix-coiled-coil-helix domain-containing protein 7 n=1 Tax=Cyanistes caeruleus TaxID=156563 RepID=A0A8C0UZ32_CYACU
MCKTWEEEEARFLPNCSFGHTAAFRRDPPALPADSVSSLKYFGEGERGTRAGAIRPFGYEYLSRMSRHAKKLRDHDINPCIAETDATTKCMNDNNYNKDLCTDYFLKYKNCRKFWHEIMMQRKRSGVKPEMPPAEERKKILDSMGKLY